MKCSWCVKPIKSGDVEGCHPLCYLKRWREAEIKKTLKLTVIEKENKRYEV